MTDFVFGFQADSRLASWFPADSGHAKPNRKRRGGLDGAKPTTKAAIGIGVRIEWHEAKA
jgi:hypothetical protein